MDYSEWAASTARADLYCNHALTLTATWWDNPAADPILTAAGLLQAITAEHPNPTRVTIPELDQLTLGDSLEAALHEVQSWDLTILHHVPDAARLRATLTDLTTWLRHTSPIGES